MPFLILLNFIVLGVIYIVKDNKNKTIEKAEKKNWKRWMLVMGKI